MDIKDKKVLVVGLGISGVAATKFLYEKGAIVTVNDLKDETQLSSALKQIKGKYHYAMLGVKPNECFDGIELIIISPGVDFNNPWVKEAQSKGIEVVSETELAYWFIPCDIVAITGTNGKTTTTVLTGEIFSSSGRKTHVVGNIGIAMTSKINEMQKDDIVICELSSFQILNCKKFAPKVFTFLNLTPDHLDKYGTMERYSESKAMMLDMMEKDSYAILNYDDEGVKKYDTRVKGKLLWFSSEAKEIPCDYNGAYVKDDKMYFMLDGNEEYITDVRDIRIMGRHNLQNSLAAAVMARIMGVSCECIKSTLHEFAGVEHRLELVGSHKGITYINDSKGTNTDAAITALKAMNKPTVLIAGGYDKGGDFDDYVKAFKGVVSDVVITGATSEKIRKCCDDNGFKNYHVEKDFDRAVKLAASLAKSGYNVLLSPACASWDAFDNYEQRGERFKAIVKGLK